MSEYEMDDRDGPGRKPDFVAYSVKDGRDGKGFFSRVGAAWAHRDGQGYDISLEAMPVNGRITLRELRDERTQDYQDERAARSSQSADRSQSRTRSRGRER